MILPRPSLPDFIQQGSRTLRTARLFDRAATLCVMSEAPRSIPVLPGLSVMHPAVEARRLSDDFAFKTGNRGPAAILDPLVRELDGYRLATDMDMALWRANT